MHMFSLFKEMIAKNVEVCYTDDKLFLFQKEALEKGGPLPEFGGTSVVPRSREGGRPNGYRFIDLQYCFCRLCGVRCYL